MSKAENMLEQDMYFIKALSLAWLTLAQTLLLLENFAGHIRQNHGESHSTVLIYDIDILFKRKNNWQIVKNGTTVI